MPRSTNRKLPASADLLLIKEELMGGCRIVITQEAGSRLAGKRGMVVGIGATQSQVKVLLDGSKRYIILHARYVDLLEKAGS